MNRELNPEALKNTDKNTAEKIEDKFVPDWEMNELFEKSYEKYSELKNENTVSENKNIEKSENMIKADIVPERKDWRNTAVRITAIAAAAALVFAGIRYLPGKGGTISTDNIGTADVTEINEPASEINNDMQEIINKSSMEYDMRPLDTGSYRFIAEAVMNDDKTYIIGEGKENSPGIKKYGNCKSEKSVVPQFGYEDILSACYADDIIYAMCEYKHKEGGFSTCVLGIDSETGKVLYRNDDFYDFRSLMMFDGENLVISNSFEGTVTYLDRELKEVQRFIDCRELLDIKKEKSTVSIYSAEVNKDGEIINTAEISGTETDSENTPHIRCILPTENNIFIAAECDGISALYAFDKNGNKLWEKEYPDYPGIGYELYEDGDSLIFVTTDFSESDADSYVHIIDMKNGDEKKSFIMEHAQFVYFDYETRKFIGEHLSDKYYYDPETGEKSEVPDYKGYDYEKMIQSGKDLVIIPSEYSSEILYSCRYSPDGADEDVQNIGNSLMHYDLTDEGELYSYNGSGSESLELTLSGSVDNEKTKLVFTDPDRYFYRCYCTGDRIYLFTLDINDSDGKVMVYDKAGEKKGEYNIDSLYWMTDFSAGSSCGFISILHDDYRKLYRLTDNEAEETDINADYDSIFNGDEEYDLYYSDSTAVYGYKISEGRSDLIIDFSDYGINSIYDFQINRKTGEILCKDDTYYILRKNQ